jgi:negative regulator of flagellin synthesis FlgM
MPIDFSPVGGPHTVTAVNRNDPEQSLQGKSRAGEAPGADKRPVVDIVSLTGSSGRIQEATRSLEQVPVVDTLRVEAFRASIEHGTYVIDPQQLADNLMEFERILATGQSGEE